MSIKNKELKERGKKGKSLIGLLLVKSYNYSVKVALADVLVPLGLLLLKCLPGFQLLVFEPSVVGELESYFTARGTTESVFAI